MSRVFRALEKAEKEKREKIEVPREEAPRRAVREISAVPREEIVKKRVAPEPPRLEFPGEDVPSILVAPPDSFAEEQFRKLKTQIFHWSPGAPHTILVTSTIPQEGKSMVSFNLARSMAQEINNKTVLIDGDLRKPSLRLPGHRNGKGLSDYLSAETPLSDILVRFEEGNLWFIPAGSPTRKSSELIGSRRMKELLASLRELGEDTYVIVDSPPILSTSEPVQLSKVVDGVIVVVRADKAPKESVRRAIQAIDRHKIIGLIFNGMEMPPSSYYSKYYYYKHQG